MTDKKVVRDGKVAVLISRGFGAGWSTWSSGAFVTDLLFHPRWVQWVEDGKQEDAEDVANEIWGEGHNVYLGGADGLDIQWVEEGAAFSVEEYDGSESLRLSDSLIYRA